MPAPPQRQGRHTRPRATHGRWSNFGGNRSSFAVTGQVRCSTAVPCGARGESVRSELRRGSGRAGLPAEAAAALAGRGQTHVAALRRRQCRQLSSARMRSAAWYGQAGMCQVTDKNSPSALRVRTPPVAAVARQIPQKITFNGNRSAEGRHRVVGSIVCSCGAGTGDLSPRFKAHTYPSDGPSSPGRARGNHGERGNSERQPSDARLGHLLRGARTICWAPMHLISRAVAIRGCSSALPVRCGRGRTARGGSAPGDLGAISLTDLHTSHAPTPSAVPDGDSCCQPYADTGQLAAEGLGYLESGRPDALSSARRGEGRRMLGSGEDPVSGPRRHQSEP